MRLPSRAALAVLLAAASACAPRKAPPDLSLDPVELLAQVRAAQGRVRSVRGEARVRADGEGMKGAVRQLVAAEKPNRLRVDALDFFGNPVATLAAADGRLALYDARARVFYRGAASPRNLARLVPLPLPADALVTILCGSAPLLDGRAVRAEPAKGYVALELAGERRTQRVEVGERAEVQRSTLSGDGGYALRFEHFAARAGGRLPEDVRLQSDAPRVGLDLHWTDVEANAAIDARLFHLDTPRGARVVDLDAGVGEAPELHRGAESSAAAAR